MLLTQLGAIRMHLQAELAKQSSQQHHNQSDIFEKAKQQKPKIAAPRLSRPKDSATLNALGEFNTLKYGNSSRRDRFYEEFPDVPESESALELQQRALLSHQQDMLKEAQRKLERERGRGRGNPHRGNPPNLDSPLLSAQTSHVDRVPFSGGGESRLSADDAGFRLDIAESAHRAQQLPPRRHWKDKGRAVSPTDSKFSVSTQDVDSMAAKNEERLQRLEAILNAGGARENSSFSDNYFQRNPAAARGGARRDSRQSERSLECEVQHLPAT